MSPTTAASTTPAAVSWRIRVPLFGPSATVRKTATLFSVDPFTGMRKATSPSAFQSPAGSAASSFFSNGFTTMYFGAEGSDGGALSGGSSPYAGVVSVSSPHPLQLGTSNLVRMTIASAGNVGIGLTNPGQRLSVAGAIESTTGGFKFPDGTVQTTAGSGNSPWVPSGTAINYATGNVGIGVASPGQKLSVAGAIESTSGGYKFPDGTVQTTASGGVSSQWTTAGANISYNAGNVGIGTTSPGEPLDVNGTARAAYLVSTGGMLLPNGGSLQFRNTGDSVTHNVLTYMSGNITRLDAPGGYIRLDTAGTERVRIDAVGNVGIGTTSPLGLLDVNGTARAAYLVSTGGMLLPNGGSLQFRNTGDSVTHNVLTYMSGNITRLDAPGGYIRLDTEGTERVRIDAVGNVGIGTSSPTGKLHVAGNIVADGTVTARYQDVAEWVDSVEPLEAGTIVIIDPSGSNRVVASDHAYDVAVAGAISVQPGIVLGEQGEGRALVAQSGRVRVKVDASFGAIRAGDLLVTSPTPGYAMRSEPIDIGSAQIHRPGTVLGKALESLAAGQGEILVLLTLQ